MKRKFIFTAFAALFFATTASAQSLEKMQWFNEPAEWKIKNKSTFVMQVPAKTDFWRVTHYGFTIDDAPFYYATYGGELEAKVKITGKYVTTYDQMGLMIRTDHENVIKTGIEYVDGVMYMSTVVTHGTSDWSVVELKDAPKSIWLKAVRKLDAVEIYYSLDDKEYKMVRTCYLKDNCPVQVGLMGASPDGKGFEAIFEHFTVKQLPDTRRLEWANKQKSH